MESTYIRQSPNQAVRFRIPVITGGALTTGQSVTITVYDNSDDSVDVNGAACTEIGSTGIYKYDSWTPATTGAWYAIAKIGTEPIREFHVDIVGLAITSLPAGGGSAYTSVSSFLSIISSRLNKMRVDYNATRALESLNRAIIAVQHRFEPLKDDFYSNIVSGTRTYQLNSSLYPYRIIDVYYNISTSKVPLRIVPKHIVDYDVAGSVSTVYRCAVREDAADTYIDLNATPGSNITNGLQLYGPYLPAVVTSADGIPLEKKWDRVLEAMVVEWETQGYVVGNDDKVFETKRVEEAMGEMTYNAPATQ